MADANLKADDGSSLSLFIRYPNQEAVHREIDPSLALRELRIIFRIQDDQQLLVNHATHRDTFFLLERMDQLFDGATLRVVVPKRRLIVTKDTPHGDKRVVCWYPGSSVEQIEAAILRGWQINGPVDFKTTDGEGLVLSDTIPNDTHVVLQEIALTRPSAARRASASRMAAARPEQHRAIHT